MLGVQVQTFNLEGKQNVWASAVQHADLEPLALALLAQGYRVEIAPLLVNGIQYGHVLTGEKPEAAGKVLVHD